MFDRNDMIRLVGEEGIGVRQQAILRGYPETVLGKRLYLLDS